jgi:hypothetical protein
MNINFPKQLPGFGPRTRHVLIFIFALLLIAWVVWFCYTNWYQVVVRPPALSQSSVERGRTKILTNEYDAIDISDQTWKNRPTPADLPNIFDPNRSKPAS